MGRYLSQHSAVARDLFERAKRVLEYDLLELCLTGPQEKLSATEYSQPALFVVGMAAAKVWEELNPDQARRVTAAAGLSLGEYTAVCFAGGVSFEDALRLVQRRGQAMQSAADVVQSGMASILGLDLEQVRKRCDEARDNEVLQPANLLCPGNIAISGHLSAIDRLEQLSAGQVKLVRLSVAGAFHTSLMEPAVAKLESALAETPIADTKIPVYSNVDSAPHQQAAEIRQLLAKQVVSPVLWEDSIRAMVSDGIGGFVELGTGRVLRGTIKRIDRKLPTDGFGDEE
jgi:[acyl-carrier-protein] S-malonyltransferase